MREGLSHALSIDVEDYFQVLNLRASVQREDWEKMELRCGDSTRRILDLLDRHSAKATFFFLGWIAERLPDLVRDVASAGHEIGSHGYDHQLLNELGEDGFREDLRRTRVILEELTGSRPELFRACTWSIGPQTLWALPILQEEGIQIDSSIFPVAHPDYGMPAAPRRPYRISLTDAGELREFPPLTLKLLGKCIPVGGGGYLRLFPLRLITKAIDQSAAEGLPACLYLHPWEVDPEQPRFGLTGLRAFRHYVNLGRTIPKLERLLRQYRFVGLKAALDQCESWFAKCSALTAKELSG
ncbi:MAG: XrtA system polysaccharide deacetylase [Planctomycetota bacterium]